MQAIKDTKETYCDGLKTLSTARMEQGKHMDRAMEQCRATVQDNETCRQASTLRQKRDELSPKIKSTKQPQGQASWRAIPTMCRC